MGSFSTFLGPNGLLLRLEFGLTTVLGSSHVVEHHSFSMFPSIVMFDFGVIFYFWGALMGHFWGWEGFKNCFRVYSCS